MAIHYCVTQINIPLYFLSKSIFFYGNVEFITHIVNTKCQVYWVFNVASQLRDLTRPKKRCRTSVIAAIRKMYVYT